MKLTELLTNPRFTKKFFRGTLLIILITIAVIFGLFNTEKLLAVVNTLGCFTHLYWVSVLPLSSTSF